MYAYVQYTCTYSIMYEYMCTHCIISFVNAESRMPCAIASSEFARLVSRLVQLRELGEEATSQFLSGGADTSGFQPLMFEVFSLTSGALAAPAEAVTVTADSSSQQPADMAAAAYSANSGLVP